jgi:hypothetical protein
MDNNQKRKNALKLLNLWIKELEEAKHIKEGKANERK